MLAYCDTYGRLEPFEGDTTMPELSKYQLSLIIKALENRRTNEVCNSKWYNDYTDIIIAIKNYQTMTSERSTLTNITKASEDDWKEFWSSNSPELTSNNMY